MAWRLTTRAADSATQQHRISLPRREKVSGCTPDARHVAMRHARTPCRAAQVGAPAAKLQAWFLRSNRAVLLCSAQPSPRAEPHRLGAPCGSSRPPALARCRVRLCAPLRLAASLHPELAPKFMRLSAWGKVPRCPCPAAFMCVLPPIVGLSKSQVGYNSSCNR